MRIIKLKSGFTLIEIAIVLLIVTILLGYSVAMVPVQQELKQYREVNAEMNEIVNALVGFAQINGRLPCPDTTGIADASGDNSIIDGIEDTDDGFDESDLSIAYVDDFDAPVDGIIDGCRGYFGFLPAGTLGLNGDIDGLGRLLDPWGEPYGYHVSDVNADANGDGDNSLGDFGVGIDIVSPNGVREEGISNVNPDLVICDDSDNSTAADVNCAAVSATNVYTSAAAVLISSGKDRGKVASDIQDENRDDFDNGTNDKVYTYSSRSDVTNAEYDDIVKWISPNLLFSKMIEAGQLP